MNKYIARIAHWSPSFGINRSRINTIDEIIIEKETPKMFYFDGSRWAKSTEDYTIFDTYQEARKFLLQELTDKMTTKRGEIIIDKEKLKQLSEKRRELQEQVDKDNLNKTTTFS